MQFTNWLYNKHKGSIEITGISSGQLRLNIIPDAGYNLSRGNTYNSLVDWEKIPEHFSFFYDFEGNEPIIKAALRHSKLFDIGNLLIETQSDLPVIKVAANYFIEHWEEFVNASCGMGTVIISEDRSLLMEFTDDKAWYLFSNFPIMH